METTEPMSAAESPRAIPSGWLTVREAAAHLKLSMSWLDTLRRKGGGPKFYRSPTGTVRYLLADLDAWARGESTGG